MASPPSEQQVKEVNTQVKTFRENAEIMLGEAVAMFNAGVDSTLKNYLIVQEAYLQGHENIFSQAKSGNEDMLKNLTQNFNNLKQSLQKHYDAMNSSLSDGYGKSVAAFKKRCEETISKFPDIKPNSLNDALKFLTEQHTKITEANSKQLKGMFDNLDKKYKTLMEQLTFPAYTPPKLIIPTLPLPKESKKSTKQEASTSKKH